jgi:hypothetical protein
VRVWLEESKQNKKAGRVLLNGDKDRNRKSWELNVLNLLYSRFFFTPTVSKKSLPTSPPSIVISPFLDGSHLSLQFCIIHSFSFPPWSSSVLLSTLPFSYLPHKIYLLSPFDLRELCKRKWHAEGRGRNWRQNGGNLTRINLDTGKTAAFHSVEW